LSDAKARLGAVEELLSGEIIATAFNGIFALAGDADDPRVPQKLAAAKGRPHQHRRSDGHAARLMREGSVRAEELRAALRAVGLPDLTLAPD